MPCINLAWIWWFATNSSYLVTAPGRPREPGIVNAHFWALIYALFSQRARVCLQGNKLS